jgi:argininosuccinate lyase
MKSLWVQDEQTNNEILEFTIGKDQELDEQLACYDIIGSVAHAHMLEAVGILSHEESFALIKELKRLYEKALLGKLRIAPGTEDIHSQIEFMLTSRLGKTGKRIHTGRSRNDQVLLDLRLYLRDQIKEVTREADSLFTTLIALARKYRRVLMPGYTHMQVAMPSSFGLWFSAYAESLTDDITLFQAAYKVVNQNPLGSGAGYGSAFPLDREMTTTLLGFEEMTVNSVYAQMTRGKVERTMSFALASLAATLGKMAADICLYMGQNYRFFSFPDQLVTGSSIMPHKKNPDVFELVRGRCNRIQSLPNEITIVTSNLPTGYHRDLQLLKEMLFPAVSNLKQCLKISNFMLEYINVREGITDEDIYDQMFSVEEVSQKVKTGTAFRDAYKQVAAEIQKGQFKPQRKIRHTHIGSIGNLSLRKIEKKMNAGMRQFQFEKSDDAIANLMKNIEYQNIATD